MMQGSSPSSLSAAPTFSASDDPSRADSLIVEVAGASGDFTRVKWLGPALQVVHPINGIPTATMEARPHDGWLINTGSTSGPAVPKSIADALPDDRLIQIRTARGEPSQDACIFRGYRERITLRGTSGGRFASVGFVHEAKRIAETLDYALTGQLVRRRDQLTITPEKIIHSEAAPCVFNPDGKPNCEQRTIFRTDDSGGSTQDFYVPLFAHRYSTDGPVRIQRWTWARVFAYMFFWLRKKPDPETASPGFLLGPFPSWGGDDAASIIDRNLMAAIQSVDGMSVNPDSLGGSPSSDPLRRALLGVPRDHSIEGLDWISALKWTCFKAGVGFTLDTIYDQTLAQFRSGFRFFVPGWTPQHSEIVRVRNRVASLKLASPSYETALLTQQQVLADNDVINCQIEYDAGPCINEMRPIGAPHEFEVTVDLVPGWKYSAARTPQVDVNPADSAAVEAALIAARTDAWTRKYNRDSEADDMSAHYTVGRRWMACDVAHLSGTVYGYERPFAPFDASQYLPLSMANLEVSDAQRSDGSFSDADLPLRPRPLRQCLTGMAPGSPAPPFVQFSTDGGTSWHYLQEARVSGKSLAVMLDVQDLRQVFGQNGVSFADALIRGLARVRVTGVIEGDKLSSAGRFESTASLSRRTRGRLVVDPVGLRHRVRDDRNGSSGGNSFFKAGANGNHPADETFDERDSFSFYAALERVDRVRCFGSIEVIGLRFAGEGTSRPNLRPGDEIDAIAAEDGRHEHDVPLRSRADDVHQLIGCVTWNYDPGDGRGRACRATTTYTLEDPAEVVAFPGMRGGPPK